MAAKKKKPKPKPAKRKPTKPAPRERTRPDWAPAFLAALARTGNISAAAQEAGVNRDTFYQRRDNDGVFAAAARKALKDATDALELEARRRAHDGVTRTKGVYYLGAQIATETVTEYSDTLLMFLLRAHRPRKYRERVEHTGKNGGPILHADARDYTDEQLAAIIAGAGRGGAAGAAAGPPDA